MLDMEGSKIALKKIAKAIPLPIRRYLRNMSPVLLLEFMYGKGRWTRPSIHILRSGIIDPLFPVDVVYTWVDGNDPEFNRVRESFLPQCKYPVDVSYSWVNYDELKYSLRSLYLYAPWVNKIFVVTNGQRPKWLADHPKISVVRHDEILPNRYLPTFNSHVIGSALHRIPGLSEHFIYFNDDVLLLRPAAVRDFFTETGISYAFITRAQLPHGPAHPSEIASIRASKNARDLIHRHFGHYLNHRFKHSAHPQRKSVSIEAEERFGPEYHAFRLNKFRATNDILCCGFLHHYLSYLGGRSLFVSIDGNYIRIRDKAAKEAYQKTLEAKNTPAALPLLCVNDSGEISLDDYQVHLLTFLESYFPDPAPFEVL